MNTLIHPRHDFVLIRVINTKMVRGIEMPDISQEGKQYVVEELGPEVPEGTLKIQDKVLVMGLRGVDWDFIPGHTDLFVVKERFICLTYEEGGEF